MGSMTDEELMLRALEVARRARANGNHPFGALLADAAGVVIFEAENTVVTDRDCTGHAELNLIRTASRVLGLDLSQHVMYASTEPCPMCASAAYWAGIGRIVYGLPATVLRTMASGENPSGIDLGCRDVLARGMRSVVVVGPLLEDRAAEVHRSFWS
jgi:tRNA(Arg) A34 adenosine deaminase TadA